jgi:hypothetical protein
MLKLEAAHTPASTTTRIVDVKDPLFSDLEVDPRDIAYHLRLLCQAGFVAGALGPTGLVFTGLTWKGHDFVDAVRDQGVWTKLKQVASKSGGQTIELIVEVAKGIINGELKRHTGLDF